MPDRQSKSAGLPDHDENQCRIWSCCLSRRLTYLLIATVALALNALAQTWQQGFDFRNTANFVKDPPGATYVLSTTAYPTTVNAVGFGWTNPSLVEARDRSTGVDPRLAGINYAVNGSQVTFYVDLPAAGTYNLALAMGDEGYTQCWTQCQVQFLDGSTVVSTVTEGMTLVGSGVADK